LDDAEIGALDFLVSGIPISTLQTLATASNAKAFPGLARIDDFIVTRSALWATHSVGALTITQYLVASMQQNSIPPRCVSRRMDTPSRTANLCRRRKCDWPTALPP